MYEAKREIGDDCISSMCALSFVRKETSISTKHLEQLDPARIMYCKPIYPFGLPTLRRVQKWLGRSAESFCAQGQA